MASGCGGAGGGGAAADQAANSSAGPAGGRGQARGDVTALVRQLAPPSASPEAVNDAQYAGPASNFYISQRLKLHYCDYGNSKAPLAVLVHGGRDHARNWDAVAQRLRRDYHVIAPDLRGHGNSAWALGGQYQMQEYVLDLAQLLRMVNKFPVLLIGHSMGGAVALQYAGIYPQHVHRLVVIEGMSGPPSLVREWLDAPYHVRMRDWIAQVQDLATRVPKRYSSIEAACERMREENPSLTPEQARHLTVHGVLRNEDGTFSWLFDNYMRPFMPQTYRYDEHALDATYSKIACPTLFLCGLQSWHGDPATDGRLAPFRCPYRNIVFRDAGHWLHHDQLEAFLYELAVFLRDADAGRISQPIASKL